MYIGYFFRMLTPLIGPREFTMLTPLRSPIFSKVHTVNNSSGLRVSLLPGLSRVPVRLPLLLYTHSNYIKVSITNTYIKNLKGLDALLIKDHISLMKFSFESEEFGIIVFCGPALFPYWCCDALANVVHNKQCCWLVCHSCNLIHYYNVILYIVI